MIFDLPLLVKQKSLRKQAKNHFWYADLMHCQRLCLINIWKALVNAAPCGPDCLGQLMKVGGICGSAGSTSAASFAGRILSSAHEVRRYQHMGGRIFLPVVE
jgi:hypothetical protein